MPVTYNLIASNTLTTSAASVTFSAIPNTFIDLVLKLSTRTDFANIWASLRFQLNGDTGTNYSFTNLVGDGQSALTETLGNFTAMNSRLSEVGSTATSNTFSNTEIYIPGYLANRNKPVSAFGSSENNGTNAATSVNANLWRNTAAITSVTLFPQSSANFVSGSSFFLYGIKNS